MRSTIKEFQSEVKRWALSIFPTAYVYNRRERAHRMLEEAMELAQACGCNKEEARDLMNYVWSRPVGQPNKELGDLAVTTAALAEGCGLDLEICANLQLQDCWDKRDTIAAKQASKFDNSSLPGGLPA